MRSIETLTTKTGPDDAGLNILLTEARLEDRRARAEAMAARLDSLGVSYHIPPAKPRRSGRTAACDC